MNQDDHRWSGWPGAWCVDCGIGDPAELCMATDDGIDFVCKLCGEHWPQGRCQITMMEHDVLTIPCANHPITKCEHPGENLFNPYHQK